MSKELIRKAVDILGGVSAFAEATGLAVPTVYCYLSGTRRFPYERLGAEVERLTGGKVKRRQMLPDSWHTVWPELK